VRLSKALTLCVALVMALTGVAGCVDTRPANAAIAAANAKSVEYSELDGAVGLLMDEAGAVELTPEGVKSGIVKLDEALVKLAERKVVVADMRAEFATIPEMKVPEPVREYARKQMAIADLLLEMDEVNIVLVTDTRALYDLVASQSTDTAKAEELSTRIEQTAARLDELDEQIAAAEQEADDYFEQHDLGGK
jgi:outer membrane murein-binding lipoprotein Lpp